jgi:NAD(P)-dependent dehydrogenase (short-subunit alcohol dehydrogenase family)
VSKAQALTAIVTGAAHGIGRSCAEHLARANYNVVLADKDEEGVRRAAQGIGSPAVVDVRDEDQIAGLVAEAAAGGGLDLIVSNAGVSAFGSLAETSLSQWRDVLDTNLTASFLLAKRGEAALRRARGAMVLVASTRAHMSEPDTHAYAASKGGLVALTHSLAISLGPDIRVNCISPGWIAMPDADLRPRDHDQHPVGRVGRPEDIAEAVLYLARAGFVTGAEIVADGGMTRKMIYAD